ncbi:MAG: alanine--tRNA ligase-related protein, partial [Aggregatilineales bacterium]
MTEMLYQTDAYLKEFDAVVTAIDTEKNAVQLNRTAFFPGGGGQPADTGTLTAGDTIYPVKTVKRGNWHVIDGDLLDVETGVQGAIDWERRYKMM